MRRVKLCLATLDSRNHSSYWLVVVSASLAVILMFLVTSDVVLRYFFDRPLGWGEEVSEIMLLFLIYLALPYGTKVGGHVNLDIVVKLLSPKARSKVEILSSVLSLIFCIIFAWQGWKLTLYYFECQEVSPYLLFLPLWPIVTIMSTGISLMCLELIVKLCRSVASLSSQGSPGK